MWAYSLMNLWVCVKNQLALGCLESQKSKESDFNWVKAFKRATLRLGLLRSLEKQPSRQKQGDPQILPLSFMLLFFYPLSARKGNVHFYSSFLSCRIFLVTPSLEKNNLKVKLNLRREPINRCHKYQLQLHNTFRHLITYWENFSSRKKLLFQWSFGLTHLCRVGLS